MINDKYLDIFNEDSIDTNGFIHLTNIIKINSNKKFVKKNIIRATLDNVDHMNIINKSRTVVQKMLEVN